MFKRGLTTKLHLCCPVAFHLSHGNFYDALEGRELIKSMHFKNNSHLLMDRAYEDNKTLAKDHGFCTVVPHKKNRKTTWFYNKQLYKQCNNIERYFLKLKCFRKVFTRYDKLDSIVISIVSLFCFQLTFMWTLTNFWINPWYIFFIYKSKVRCEIYVINFLFWFLHYYISLIFFLLFLFRGHLIR